MCGSPKSGPLGSTMAEDGQNPAPYYRILTLDGGGTWALIQVHALQRLFGSGAKGHDVLEKFDLVVANSGGGIVAAALACDMTLERLRLHFEDKRQREKIFRPKLPEAIGRRLPFPRYATEVKYDGLREALAPNGELALPDWHAKHPKLAHLMFIGFDFDTNRAAFFRSHADSRSSSGSPTRATILDATHATSNAPVVYFDEPTKMHVAPHLRRYWDGAVAGYNNPSLAAAIEALANGASREQIRILSIGTGTVLRPRRPAHDATTDGRFVGGETPSVLGNLRKLAGAILDDPPDVASYMAHVTLGGRVPAGAEVVRDGPVVRMSPCVRPMCGDDGKWKWGPAFQGAEWQRLTSIDMDAIDDDDVALIVELAKRWLDDTVPNQAIRADERLVAQIGHDTFGAAAAVAEATAMARRAFKVERG